MTGMNVINQSCALIFCCLIELLPCEDGSRSSFVCLLFLMSSSRCLSCLCRKRLALVSAETTYGERVFIFQDDGALSPSLSGMDGFFILLHLSYCFHTPVGRDAPLNGFNPHGRQCVYVLELLPLWGHLSCYVAGALPPFGSKNQTCHMTHQVTFNCRSQTSMKTQILQTAESRGDDLRDDGNISSHSLKHYLSSLS